MMTGDLNERVGKLETEVENMRKELEKIDEINENVVKTQTCLNNFIAWSKYTVTTGVSVVAVAVTVVLVIYG